MARRFEFSLKTLLKVRRLREREAKRKLAAKRAEIARLERLNEQASEEIIRRQGLLRSGQQEEMLDPAELTRGRAFVGYLRRTIVERQVMIAERITELEGLQNELRSARTQTKVLEKLRERRWQAYVKHRKRAEQAESDERARQLQGLRAKQRLGV